VPVEPSEVARLLRQQSELGGGPILFETLARAEALSLARRARSGAKGADVAPPPPIRTAAPSPSPQRPAAVPAGATGTLPVLELPADLAAVREIALTCTRCSLADTRKHVVFSDGVSNPRVLVVGEAPGQNEDEAGVPFVGAAGRFLDLLLATVGLSRTENCHICNVLKCRPPQNRNPLPPEIEACTPFLRSQIQLLRPEVILATGTFAGQWVTGQSLALGKLRGTLYSYDGIPVVVTYHPAALLRNPGWIRSTWEDLQLLRGALGGA